MAKKKTVSIYDVNIDTIVVSGKFPLVTRNLNILSVTKLIEDNYA